MGKFDGLAGRGKEISVDGLKVIIKPKVKDLEVFMDKDIRTKEMIPAFINMICQGEPNEKREDVEAFVENNIGTLLQEIPIALGFISRNELEKKKLDGVQQMTPRP